MGGGRHGPEGLARCTIEGMELAVYGGEEDDVEELEVVEMGI